MDGVERHFRLMSRTLAVTVAVGCPPFGLIQFETAVKAAESLQSVAVYITACTPSPPQFVAANCNDRVALCALNLYQLGLSNVPQNPRGTK